MVFSLYNLHLFYNLGEVLEILVAIHRIIFSVRLRRIQECVSLPVHNEDLFLASKNLLLVVLDVLGHFVSVVLILSKVAEAYFLIDVFHAHKVSKKGVIWLFQRKQVLSKEDVVVFNWSRNSRLFHSHFYFFWRCSCWSERYSICINHEVFFFVILAEIEQ